MWRFQLGSIVEVQVKVMNDGGVDIYSSRSMVKGWWGHGICVYDLVQLH